MENQCPLYCAGVQISLPTNLKVNMTGINFDRSPVGQFMDERVFNQGRIMQAINQFWTLRGDVQVHCFHPYYVFEFTNAEDMLYIDKIQSLNIEGSLLVLRRAYGNMVPKNVKFQMALLWIRVEGLPLQWFHSSVAAHLLQHIGLIHEEEDTQQSFPSCRYVRVRVWVDLSKPLIPGCFLNLEGNQHMWIDFGYEGIFRHCKNCGMVGHRHSFCHLSPLQGAAQVRHHLSHLERKGLNVLFGPKDTPFYTKQIMGLPAKARFLSTRINTIAAPPSPLTDSGFATSIYTFFFSSGEDHDDANAGFDGPHEPNNSVTHDYRPDRTLTDDFPFVTGAQAFSAPHNDHNHTQAAPPENDRRTAAWVFTIPNFNDDDVNSDVNEDLPLQFRTSASGYPTNPNHMTNPSQSHVSRESPHNELYNSTNPPQHDVGPSISQANPKHTTHCSPTFLKQKVCSAHLPPFKRNTYLIQKFYSPTQLNSLPHNITINRPTSAIPIIHSDSPTPCSTPSSSTLPFFHLASPQHNTSIPSSSTLNIILNATSGEHSVAPNNLNPLPPSAPSNLKRRASCEPIISEASTTQPNVVILGGKKRALNSLSPHTADNYEHVPSSESSRNNNCTMGLVATLRAPPESG